MSKPCLLTTDCYSRGRAALSHTAGLAAAFPLSVLCLSVILTPPPESLTNWAAC